MLKKFIFTLVFFICFNANATDFTASVNRNPVPEGETVVLTLDYNDKTSETPDFSTLEKDFTIVSVSQSFRSNYINGQMSNSQQWTLVLIPATQGEITIPSIYLGKDKTSPIHLKVVAANSSNITPAQSGPKYAISGAVDNKNPYVQQQINYQLTILDSGGLQGSEPYIISNDNEWIVKNLGKPKISNKIENGKKYREIQFNYALFPQKSGRLSLPRFKFDGFYLTKSSRAAVDPFADIFGQDLMLGGWGLSGMFATRNPVVLTTPAEDIEVKPIPLSNQGKWWLPAENVTLSASFEGGIQSLKTGDAITRTIILTATGVIDKQLPELNFSETEGLKQYPEKPQVESFIKGDKIVVISKINVVYIPTKPGEVKIPEISVEWFNVKTEKTEKTILPAESINVLLGNDAEQLSPPKIENVSVNINREINKNTTSAEEEISSFSVFDIIIWLIVAFVSGIFISWILFRLGKNQADKIEDKSLASLDKDVVDAAKAKNLRLLRDAIILWASKQYAPFKVTNLQDVISLTGDVNFAKQLQELNVALYGQSASDWNETDFIKTFNLMKKVKSKGHKPQKILPDLYKK